MFLCDVDTRRQLETYMKLSDKEIEEEIKSEKAMLEDSQKEFDTYTTKLEKQFEAIVDKRDKIEADVKASGLALLKTIQSANSKRRQAVKDESKDEL
jgi:uncharacterized protein (DUF488 family)